MKYYEIVRLTSDGPDHTDFETVKKLIDRGWNRKAVDFLSNWDYGDENIDAARCLGTVRSTPTDEREQTDVEVATYGTYHLCMCNPSRNGGYEAVYLVGECDEEDWIN